MSQRSQARGEAWGAKSALLLAKEGAHVVVNDFGTTTDGEGADRTVAQSVVQEIGLSGGDALANADDVSTMEGGQHIVQMALDNWGQIDILVNNAGIMRDASILDMSEKDWDAVIAVHLKGHFSCSQAACRAMVNRSYGRIVNVSSLAAVGVSAINRLDASAGRTNYSAAKAGVLGFTRTLAREVERHGITCNAVMPTATTRLMLSAQEKRKARGVASSPNAHISRDPAHIGPLVGYLVSEHARNITGRTFWMDRGRVELYSDPGPVKGIEAPVRWTIDELAKSLPALFA